MILPAGSTVASSNRRCIWRLTTSVWISRKPLALAVSGGDAGTPVAPVVHDESGDNKTLD